MQLIWVRWQVKFLIFRNHFIVAMCPFAGASNLALAGTAVVGVLLLLSARFIQKSPFFRIPRESAGRSSHRADSSRASL